MNFGVIGFGKIGRKFVKSIQNTDGGKIYAIGSKSLSEDDGYLIENPDVTVYQNYEELLEALKTKFNDGMTQLKEDVSYIGKIRKVEANFCFDAQMSKKTDSYLFDPLQGGALNDVGPYKLQEV